MRKYTVLLVLFALVLTLMPMHVARAQDVTPLTSLEYMNAILDYTTVAGPLSVSMADKMVAATKNQALFTQTRWLRSMQRLIDDAVALNTEVYEIDPPARYADAHLVFVASVAYFDAGLDRFQEFIDTGDIAEMDKSTALFHKNAAAMRKFGLLLDGLKP